MVKSGEIFLGLNSFKRNIKIDKGFMGELHVARVHQRAQERNSHFRRTFKRFDTLFRNAASTEQNQTREKRLLRLHSSCSSAKCIYSCVCTVSTLECRMNSLWSSCLRNGGRFTREFRNIRFMIKRWICSDNVVCFHSIILIRTLLRMEPDNNIIAQNIFILINL